jgi:hypothetical protein
MHVRDAQGAGRITLRGKAAVNPGNCWCVKSKIVLPLALVLHTRGKGGAL